MRKKKSRILALVLCMAMLLGNSILAFAGESAEAEDPQGGTVVLAGSAAGYDVTLTGPADSFPADGELAVSVEEVSADTEALVKSAVDAQAQAQQMEVAAYTALDIRLFCDGQEVQPQGPVSVAFTGKTARDAGPDETKVYHVDETAGTAEDMGAAVAEDGQITMETDHFSIYVVVDLEGLGGSIDLTVQHWANMEMLDGVDGRDGLVSINGKPLDCPDGTSGNNPVRLRTKKEFCEIYSDDVIELDNTLTKSVEELSKILLSDPDEASGRYELAEVWFLTEGDPDSGNAKWDIKPASSDETVTLTENTTIRFVYNPVTQDNALVRDVTFYDYDVTDGKTYNANGQADPNGKYLNTADQGINSDRNYSGGNTLNRLAVGMTETFVDHSYHDATSANGSILNWSGGEKLKAKTGIVTGISGDGPIYNGVYDAGLFNNVPKIGKTILNEYHLVFNQYGDTYTLTSVTKGSGETATTVEEDLETITDVYDDGKTQLYSNNFWPLDTESHAGQDPLMGEKGSEWISLKKHAAAASDDNRDHNWFFGMRYSMGFVLGDYTGPLNYYFRGDDDFWLFVDGKLATDLGGIHSSIGKILDLSSYVMADPDNGPTEEEKWALHRIDIVYAERGAFGSTCYMQFTLPNLRPVDFDTNVPKTEITVQKNWQDHNNPERPDSIQVELYYQKDGTSEETLYDTQTLSAANGWTYTWKEMPKKGYTYRIKEVGEEDGKNGNYTVTYGSGDKTDGTLTPGSGGDDALLGTITNRITPSTYITVNKVWNDQNDQLEERPESVDFYLYYRHSGDTSWKPYPDGRLTLTQGNAPAGGDGNTWSGTYADLPVYTADGKTLLEYTVMEVSGDTPLGQGDSCDGVKTKDIYTVSYPDSHFGADDTWNGYKAVENNETLNLTVTNIVPQPWQLIKRSSTSEDLTLPGAQFTLTGPAGGTSVTLTGVSDADGVVQWTDASGAAFTGFLQDGSYTLKETAAPTGYRLETDEWTLKIENGAPVMIAAGQEDTGSIEGDIVTFYFDNEPMYALPSSGGPGIYVPVISGILLMAAGALAGFGYRRKGYRK